MFKDYFKVFKKSFKLSLLTMFEYRVDFYSSIILQMAYYGIQFLFLTIIFSHITTLTNWYLSDILFLLFLNDLGLSLLESTGISGIYYAIISGSLNTKLVKPKNTLFLLIFEELNIAQLGYVIFDIIALIFISLIYNLPINILPLIIGLLAFIFALPLIILPSLFINTLAFFIGDTESIVELYYSLIYSLKEYPISIFNKLFIILFSIISPGILLFYYIPSAIILGKINWMWGIYGILASIALNIIGYLLLFKLFKKGLKKYEGYG